MTKSRKELESENKELRSTIEYQEKTIEELRNVINCKNLLLAKKSLPPLDAYMRFGQKVGEKDNTIRDLQFEITRLKTTIKTIIKLSKE